MPLTFSAATVLQKAALDEGFDIELGEHDGWLRFNSTQTPAQIALSAADRGDQTTWIAAISPAPVATELRREFGPGESERPAGFASVFRLHAASDLHHLLARARMLGRSVPTRPLEQFVATARPLPRTTEAERLVVQRVGQDIFRAALIEFWDRRCPISGIDEPALLRASHMKPWSACGSDAERLDVYNGLLLAAHLDAAFDAGLITFAPDGALCVSPRLAPENVARLSIHEGTRLNLSPLHAPYMDWHRLNEFKQ